MQSDVSLRLCPFCGGENVAYSAEAEAVICMVCSCEGPWAKTPTEAIAAWNQRADAQGEPVAWQAPIHADDCEAMQRPRADCTCSPIYPARTHPPAQDVAALVEAYRTGNLVQINREAWRYKIETAISFSFAMMEEDTRIGELTAAEKDNMTGLIIAAILGGE